LNIFPVEDTVPGFKNYLLAFQLPDLWLVFTSILTGVSIFKKKEISVFFGIALGSSMLFFGLYALLYDIVTGLILEIKAGEIFGKGVTVYNIVVGIIIMIICWKNRKMFL